MHNRIFIDFLLSIGWVDSRILVGLLTGRCLLAAHAVKIGLVEDKTCRKCKYHEKTMERIICECPAFSRQRIALLGEVQLHDLQTAIGKVPKCLKLFAKGTAVFVSNDPLAINKSGNIMDIILIYWHISLYSLMF